MATTLKDMLAHEPEALAEAVAASARQIWQAGLGAFARERQEGGGIFDLLVREGAELHRLTQQAGLDTAALDQAGLDKAGGVAGTVGRLAENVGRQASGSWERIEKIFDDRVARALHGLGVPTRAELDALRREVDALRAELAAARPAPRTASRAPAKAKPAQGAAAPKRAARTGAGRHA